MCSKARFSTRGKARLAAKAHIRYYRTMKWPYYCEKCHSHHIGGNNRWSAYLVLGKPYTLDSSRWNERQDEMTLQENVGQKMIEGVATDKDILGAEWDWFVKKKKGRCAGEEDECFYRHAGKKCAVGIFIPKDRYDSEMEGTGNITELLMSGYMPEFEEYVPLLQSLQLAHDNWSKENGEFTQYMKDKLVTLGYKESEA